MNIKKYLIVILTCVCCFALCSCCLRNKEASVKYYHMGMFDSLSLNESTLKDVLAITPDFTLIMTSFGGVAEFSVENEQYIQIKFVGKEMVVSSIELVDTPWNEGQGDGLREP